MLNVVEFPEVKGHVGFQVIDLNTADYCLEKIQELNSQIKEKQDFAQAKIDKINMWLTDEVERITDQKAYFEGLLTEYAMEQRRLNPKFRLSTPAGKVSFRKQPAKWNYKEEEIINWAKQNDRIDLIRVKEELDKKQLKWYAKQAGNCAVTEDGEVIPGIEIVEQDEAIKIEVSE